MISPANPQILCLAAALLVPASVLFTLPRTFPESPVVLADQSVNSGQSEVGQDVKEDSAAPNPADLKSIGGRWYVSDEPTPVYYYKDGDRFADLFSYHQKDSNNDGIANLRIRHDDRRVIVQSQGYPNHPTAVFPNSGNPNSIRVQEFEFSIPLVPEYSETISQVPMGPIGFALNGVVFFNPFEVGGMNAVEGYSEVWLDSCCGHPENRGVYHYHKYPVCVKSPFRDDGKGHSPVIGFAFDGFPVYGPYEADGIMAKDATGPAALDVCNGHSDHERGYHYHVTPERFPYVIGGYHGVPDRANLRGPRTRGDGAIQDNASGESRLANIVQSLKPGNATAGRKHTITIELNPDSAGRHGLPAATPSWVHIGPFEATEIKRDGNVVTVLIDIPGDAPVGVLMDCHFEFPAESGRPQAFKTNSIFRVVAQE